MTEINVHIIPPNEQGQYAIKVLGDLIYFTKENFKVSNGVYSIKGLSTDNEQVEVDFETLNGEVLMLD